MTTLKDLTEMFGKTLSDMQIIKEWFTRNNQEAEGLKLVSELTQSQLNKVERKYDYARTWIPVKVDMCDVCRDKDVARKLDKIINYQILEIEIPDDLLKWAKETIPTMKMPSLFFIDTAKWLDERFGIKFKEGVRKMPTERAKDEFAECRDCLAWSGSDCTRHPYKEGCLKEDK